MTWNPPPARGRDGEPGVGDLDDGAAGAVGDDELPADRGAGRVPQRPAGGGRGAGGVEAVEPGAVGDLEPVAVLGDRVPAGALDPHAAGRVPAGGLHHEPAVEVVPVQPPQDRADLGEITVGVEALEPGAVADLVAAVVLGHRAVDDHGAVVVQEPQLAPRRRRRRAPRPAGRARRRRRRAARRARRSGRRPTGR